MNIKSLLVSASLIVVTCASMNASASSRVYKWKDKDGVIHYSQNAPQGESAEMITTKTPRTPLPDANATPASTPAPAAPSTAPASQAKNNSKTEEAVFKKDQATCDKITKDLETLRQQPIVTMNGKVMTIEEKNAHLKVLEDGQAANCP